MTSVLKAVARWDPEKLSVALRVLGAVVGIVVAIGLRLLLDGELPPGFPYLTIFPVVLLATFLLGTLAGVAVAVVCGFAAWYLFIPPLYSFALTGASSVALAFYVFIVATEIVLIHLMRQALRALEVERQANALLAEQRKLMFHELQHRVSNNLATVSGLLKLQRRIVADDAAGLALDDSVRRIDLVARLMRRLHDPQGQAVDMARFLTDAGQDMLESGGAKDRVTLKVRSAPLVVGPEVSVPLGLIATELVANTLEHGFPGDRRGIIEVSLDTLGSGRAKLRIADDGRGVPDGFDIARTKSLGLSIARQFARQLGGTLEILARPEGGTEARLEFTY
ncbi:MAG: DUF4118 domain-containing protein [Tabrizicola sp.]|nr:DUF4118 domain-containing protein [Tabrizicola sp.]